MQGEVILGAETLKYVRRKSYDNHDKVFNYEYEHTLLLLTLS